jgi:hypothetical protein
MRYQKTPLRSEINVYTPHQTLSVGRCNATNTTPSYVASHCDRTGSQRLQQKFTPERLCDADTATAKKLQGQQHWCNKNKNKRENDHGNARQTRTHRFRRDSLAHPQIALGGIGR